MPQIFQIKVFVIFLQGLVVLSSDLKVSLLYPFALTSSSLVIRTIDNDLQRAFLMVFFDGQARRYSADNTAT